MDVYLVRHAFADHADPARWPDDTKRPLTAEGRERFRRAARGLEVLVPTVEAVLSSGWTRAWQTAELLHEVAGWPAPEELPELEGARRPAAAAEALRGRSEGSIALVGHEPHLSSLASLLLTGSESGLEITLKKGGVIALELDGAASLLWSATPKMLRRIESR
jgi:phosphohistidine phosphatase